MLYQIKSYITFLLRSKNRHGVHSPFVYDLVTRCFYDKKRYPEYQKLDAYRHQLLADHEIIEVTDFGAGSRIFRSNSRKTSAIARHAGITKKRQRLLFRLARYLQPGSILELGTSLGLSSAALALGKPTAIVTTIEGCKNTSEKAAGCFDDFQLKNIKMEHMKFEDFLRSTSSAWDLIFIDGNHDRDKTLAYFDFFQKTAMNTTVIVFDDIYWNRSMTDAWQQIISNERVTVSIDTFNWGLVFFRQEQKKQHFKIRM